MDAGRRADPGDAGLALHDEQIHFTNFGDIEPGFGNLWRVSPAGGAPETLLSGRDMPFCVAVDEEAMYWAELEGHAIYKLAR